MQAVADGIYYENAYPGVTLGAVIQPRGTLMIDAPLRAEDARTWRSVLLTQSHGTHRLLVNLDAHTDRTIGTRHMDCTVVAQDHIMQAYDNRTSIFKGQPLGSRAEWENHPEVSGTRWILPNMTFSNHMSFHWGEAEIILEHHPGPTYGAAWVIVPSAQVVFIGDAILLNQPPFLATSNLPQWIETISVLRTPRYRNYTIISGRGGPVEIEYIRTQHEQLKLLHKRLEALAEKGATPEDTVALIPAFLEKLDYHPALQETYEQRLRFGLEAYYQQHYIPEENQNGN